ncbi:MAG: hypothetical protein KIT09_31700 [Bryobacteraceae bacterium]|nr:hypothetical protein [Bryobacteraceae bacterium]
MFYPGCPELRALWISRVLEGGTKVVVTEISNIFGFAVINILYAVIGLLAAAGSVVVSQKHFPGRSEQIFYGVFLAFIAGFYLAFVAYFRNASAWNTELSAVAAFSLLGIVGTRYAAVLILGYSLHGIWDLLHELSAHTGYSVLRPEQFTSITLAYGMFCVVYDVAISVYFVRRRGSWRT